MKVERLDDEILVRIKAGTDTNRLQALLDYLRYEEITSGSTATAEDVNQLVNEVKKGRWQRVKKEIGVND